MSSSLKYNTKLYFLSTNILEYIISTRPGGPGGIVGIRLNEHALCRWALSLHICSRLTKDIADLKEATLVEVAHHKEQSTSRIKADSDDRNATRAKLGTCVDPLDVSQCQNLINIVTQISMLKTLFQLEKHSCNNSSQLVPQDSTKRSRGRLLPRRKARRSEERIQWNSVTQD